MASVAVQDCVVRASRSGLGWVLLAYFFVHVVAELSEIPLGLLRRRGGL